MISCAARKRAKASVLQERVIILQTCLLSVFCGYLPFWFAEFPQPLVAFIYSVPVMYYYRYGEAGRIYLLPVGVLLVSCSEVWTGRIRSIPAVFHSPPW